MFADCDVKHLFRSSMLREIMQKAIQETKDFKNLFITIKTTETIYKFPPSAQDKNNAAYFLKHDLPCVIYVIVCSVTDPKVLNHIASCMELPRLQKYKDLILERATHFQRLKDKYPQSDDKDACAQHAYMIWRMRMWNGTPHHKTLTAALFMAKNPESYINHFVYACIMELNVRLTRRKPERKIRVTYRTIFHILSTLMQVSPPVFISKESFIYQTIVTAMVECPSPKPGICKMCSKAMTGDCKSENTNFHELYVVFMRERVVQNRKGSIPVISILCK